MGVLAIYHIPVLKQVINNLTGSNIIKYNYNHTAGNSHWAKSARRFVALIGRLGVIGFDMSLSSQFMYALQPHAVMNLCDTHFVTL